MTTEPREISRERSIQQWLATAAQHANLITDSIQNDLRVLVAHHLQRSTTWVIGHPEAILTPDVLGHLDLDFERYQQGTPLPYLTGKVEFFGRSFFVSPAVLIPRSETELLVETAVRWLGSHPACLRMVDVGCGSGIIPISIALNHRKLLCTAVDISWQALQITRQNCLNHGVHDRVDLVCSDLGSALDFNQVSLVTANLPYIPTEDAKKLAVSQYEPMLALDGGVDGIRLIRHLLNQCTGKMVRPFCILLEIEYRQADLVKSLSLNYFHDIFFSVHNDLAGLPRLAEIRGDQ
jgi:release factor glutamine methyltransferase